MLTDKITMRKIRYDVFEFIEKSNLISEIERFLENKELFINDLDYPKDLLKRAELDYYDDDLDLLSQKLEKFIEDYNSEESLVHAPIIDYLNEVNSIVLQDPDNKEAITEAEDKVENFVFQLVQVEKLLLDMVTSSFDLYYIGEDNNVYDRDSDEKIFDYNDIVKGDIDPNDIDIGDAVRILRYEAGLVSTIR